MVWHFPIAEQVVLGSGGLGVKLKLFAHVHSSWTGVINTVF